MATDAEVLEELKKIREALAPTPPPAEPEKKKSILMEFKDFITPFKELFI